MAHYIDKDALVAEIERRRDRITKGIFSIPLTGSDRASATFEYEILGKIKDFINTLEVKEVDLENEIKQYIDNHRDVEVGKADTQFNCYDMEEIARYFTNWQKEQLMKNAIDVTVHIEAGNYPYIPQMELYDYDKDVPLAKEGDKYKVVLIKEG
jgi:hypothetical protein